MIMCTNPVKIKNRKILFRDGIDKVSLTVNCNHCWQCVQQRVNEWFVRLENLWRKYKSNGWSCFFITISYAEDEIPTLGKCLNQYYRPDMPLYNADCYCFDKRAIRQFMNYLRKEYGSGLKFFVTTEFGMDEDKTLRSHYHALIFCPCKVDSVTFLTNAEFYWSHSIIKNDVPENILKQLNTPEAIRYTTALGFDGSQKHRFLKAKNTPYFVSQQGKIRRYFKQRGWVMYSKDYSPEIESPAGILYVLKYLHKDALSISPSYQFFLSLKEYYKEKTSLEVSEDIPLRDAIRSALPFYMSSQGLGLDLYDAMKDYNAKYLYNIYSHGINVYGKQYPIPQYITRKLFYTKDFIDGRKEPIMILNDKGIEFYKLIFNQSVKGMTSQLNKMFSKDFLDTVNFDGLKLDCLKQFRTKDEAVSFLIRHFKQCESIAPDSLATYYFCYQNVSTYCVVGEHFNANRESLITLTNLGKNLFNFKLDSYFLVYDRGLDGLLLDFHDMIRRTGHHTDYAGFSSLYNHAFYCNEFEVFEYFDDILNLHKYIYNYIFSVVLKDALKDLVNNIQVKQSHYQLLKVLGYV